MSTCPKCGKEVQAEVNFCGYCGTRFQSSSVARDPYVGKTIDGRYRVKRLIARGGMGDVYEAEHLRLQHRLAIKFLPHRLSADDVFARRFQQEAMASCRINHPFAVVVQDYGQYQDGPFYMVMEYVGGVTLTQVLSEYGSLSPAEAVYIGLQLCQVLVVAHSQGVVHRDLKPDNLMLVETSWPVSLKVLDFGIAKVLGETENELTQAGQIVGTPEFMAPEQAMSQPVDERTDIYAVGMLLYKILTQRLPFEGSNKMSIINSQINDIPMPPDEKCPDLEIPHELVQVIMTCLEKLPENRFQSIHELQLAMEDFPSAPPKLKNSEAHRARTSSSEIINVRSKKVVKDSDDRFSGVAPFPKEAMSQLDNEPSVFGGADSGEFSFDESEHLGKFSFEDEDFRMGGSGMDLSMEDEFDYSSPSFKPKRFKFIWVMLLLVGVVIGGYFGYTLVFKKTTQQPETETISEQESDSSLNSSADVIEDSASTDGSFEAVASVSDVVLPNDIVPDESAPGDLLPGELVPDNILPPIIPETEYKNFQALVTSTLKIEQFVPNLSVVAAKKITEGKLKQSDNIIGLSKKKSLTGYITKEEKKRLNNIKSRSKRARAINRRVNKKASQDLCNNARYENGKLKKISPAMAAKNSGTIKKCFDRQSLPPLKH